MNGAGKSVKAQTLKLLTEWLKEQKCVVNFDISTMSSDLMVVNIVTNIEKEQISQMARRVWSFEVDKGEYIAVLAYIISGDAHSKETKDFIRRLSFFFYPDDAKDFLLEKLGEIAHPICLNSLLNKECDLKIGNAKIHIEYEESENE